MPIPFDSIPEHIGLSVIEMLELRDFSQFHESSRKSYAVSKKIKTRFVLHLNPLRILQWNEEIIIKTKKTHTKAPSFVDLPIMFEAPEVVIDGSLTQKICNTLLEYRLNANSIEVAKNISCSPELFNRLIEFANIRGFISNRAVSREYLQVPAIRKIEYLSATCLTLDDSDLLALKVPSLHLLDTVVSSNGINLMLHEWLNSDRKISDVFIQTSVDLERETILAGIPNIVSSPCYIHLRGDEAYYIDKDHTRKVITLKYRQFIMNEDRIV